MALLDVDDESPELPEPLDVEEVEDVEPPSELVEPAAVSDLVSDDPPEADRPAPERLSVL